MNDSAVGRALSRNVLTVALVVRVLAGATFVSNGRAYFPDSELYWGYAESLAKTGAFQAGGYGARRTPGYPLFIAACTRLAGSQTPLVPPPIAQLEAVLIAQTLLGLLIVAMVQSLGDFLARGDSSLRHAGYFAALVAAFDPFAISVEATVLSETLFTAAMVGAVWLGRKALDAHLWRGRAWAMAAGAAAALAILTRPSGLLLAPIGLIAVSRRWGVQRSALAALAFVLVLSPWVLRNARLYHAFVPTTLNVGESLYDGWNPDAKGGSDMAFVDHRKREHGAASGPAAELAEDAFWKREALDWAKDHPGRVLELALVKIGRFWSPWPNAAEFQSPSVMLGCGLFSLLTYGGAAVGVVVLWRKRRWGALTLGLAPAAYFAALHAVFVSSVRYRVPAMPILELLTGVGLAWMMNRRRQARDLSSPVQS